MDSQKAKTDIFKTDKISKVETENKMDLNPQEKPKTEISPEIGIDGLHNIHTDKNDEKITEFSLFYPNGIMKVSFVGNSFMFKDDTNVISEKFSIDDIFDYILYKKGKLETDKKISPEVIKILEVTIFKKNDSGIFELYTNSPFMKDISIMRFLIDVLENYTSEKVKDDKNDRNSAVLKFTYSIMEHTLNIFDAASFEIKDKQLGNEKVNMKLTKYSVGLVYKIIKHLNTSISMTEKKYKNIISTLDELKIVSDKLENKIIISLNDTIKYDELIKK